MFGRFLRTGLQHAKVFRVDVGLGALLELVVEGSVGGVSPGQRSATCWAFGQTSDFEAMGGRIADDDGIAMASKGC